MLLALLTLGFASAEAPACPEPMGWWSEPTARSLEPVRPAYIARHRELMAEVSAGPGASPLFRDPWSQMEVVLAMQQAGQLPPPLAEPQAQRYRELSVVAATMATERLIQETLGRSELTSTLLVLSRTLVGPNLALEGSTQGTRVRVNQSAEERRPEQVRARLDEPLRPPPRRPHLGVGAGSSLVSADPERDDAPLALAWKGWVSAENLGAQSLRASVDLVQLSLDPPMQTTWSLGWTVDARRQLGPRLALNASASSVLGGPQPRLVRSGLSYRLDRTWSLRLSGTSLLPQGDHPPEYRAELRLSYAARWRVPAQVDGRVLGAPDPWWEARPGTAANPTALAGPCRRGDPMGLHVPAQGRAVP